MRSVVDLGPDPTHLRMTAEPSVDVSSPPAAPPVAEVVASSTREFVVEVYEDAEVPEFGSWLEVRPASGARLYGLVSHVETGSIEPGRQAVALGKDREDLQREWPQLAALIRTTARAQVLAHWDGRTRRKGGPAIRQTLPPQPANLHDRVTTCNPETVASIGAPYDFLRTLARHPDPAVPADDLLVAVLRGLYDANGRGEQGQAVLVDAGRSLMRLLDDDHERLTSILRRAHDAL